LAAMGRHAALAWLAILRSPAFHSTGEREMGLPSEARPYPTGKRRMERETGIEPATNSLEGCDSTTELLPPSWYPVRPRHGGGPARPRAAADPLRHQPGTALAARDSGLARRCSFASTVPNGQP